MAKKKVAAVVKIQIPAGQATPGAARRHRARPARRGDHGLLQGVQRADRGAARHDRPRRDHDLRGPLVHFILKTPPTPVLLRAGRRPRQGRQTPRARRSPARSPTAQVEEIAKTKMPDLNANDLEAAKIQVAGTARSMGITGRLSSHRSAAESATTGSTGTTSPGRR